MHTEVREQGTDQTSLCYTAMALRKYFGFPKARHFFQEKHVCLPKLPPSFTPQQCTLGVYGIVTSLQSFVIAKFIMALKSAKQVLRKEIKKRVAALSNAEKQRQSQNVTNKVILHI